MMVHYQEQFAQNKEIEINYYKLLEKTGQKHVFYKGKTNSDLNLPRVELTQVLEVSKEQSPEMSNSSPSDKIGSTDSKRYKGLSNSSKKRRIKNMPKYSSSFAHSDNKLQEEGMSDNGQKLDH